MSTTKVVILPALSISDATLCFRSEVIQKELTS